MATLYKEFTVTAPAAEVWDAIRDVGAVHLRLAQGFVTDVKLEGDARIVTFANGVTARERILAVDEEHRRLAYSSVGGRLAHHNASFQVFESGTGSSRVLWITDLLPEEMAEAIRGMVELGAQAIQRTLGGARSSG